MLSSTADSRSWAGMAKEAKPLSITRSSVPPPCSVRNNSTSVDSPSCTIVRFAGFPSPIHHPGWLTRSHTAAMGASISLLRLHTSRLTLGYTLKS